MRSGHPSPDRLAPDIPRVTSHQLVRVGSASGILRHPRLPAPGATLGTPAPAPRSAPCRRWHQALGSSSCLSCPATPADSPTRLCRRPGDNTSALVTSIVLRLTGSGKRTTVLSASEVEVEVIDVVDGDVGECRGTHSAFLKIDLFESFGDDSTHLLVAGSGGAGGEQALW